MILTTLKLLQLSNIVNFTFPIKRNWKNGEFVVYKYLILELSVILLYLVVINHLRLLNYRIKYWFFL